MSLPFLFGEALALPFSASYHFLLLMLVCFRCGNLTSSQVLLFVFGPCFRSTCQVPFSLDPAPLGMTAFLKGCNLVLPLTFRIGLFFVIFILLPLLSVSSLCVTPCVLWLFFCCLLFCLIPVSSWLCYVQFVSRLLFGCLLSSCFFFVSCILVISGLSLPRLL